MSDFSPADLAAVTGNESGWGGGNSWVLILLFAMIFGWGGGGFGFGRGNGPVEQPVTESSLCNAMNFNNLENAVGRLSDNENLHMMQLSQGLSTVGYENLRNFSATQDAVKDGDYALSRQLADCCCTTQRGIDGVNYNAAMNTAAINANTTAQTQKVLDAISQNKIDSLQAQVSELKTQQMFCGVPRISPYGYGVVPSFANQCGCASI